MNSLYQYLHSFSAKGSVFIVVLLPLVFLSETMVGQDNFIGKSEEFVINYFRTDTVYTLKTDTIDRKTILLTFRPKSQYPFYTYEIDLRTDQCISYGMVSKNTDVLNTYISVLNFLGEKIETDPANITYRVRANTGIFCYYYIKQPYINSKVESKKRIFYVLVSPEN